MSQEKITNEVMNDKFTYTPNTSYTPVTYEELAGSIATSQDETFTPVEINILQPETIEISNLVQNQAVKLTSKYEGDRDPDYDLMRRAGSLLKIIDSKTAHRDLAYLETIIPDPKLRRAILVKELLQLWKSGLTGQELVELGTRCGYSLQQVNNLSIFLWNHQKDVDEVKSEKLLVKLTFVLFAVIVLLIPSGIFFGVRIKADASFYEVLVFLIFALAYGVPTGGKWLGRKAITAFLQFRKDVLWPRGLFPFETHDFIDRKVRWAGFLVLTIRRILPKLARK